MSNLKSPGFTCWLTGLSGAGKTTVSLELAKGLEKLSVPYEYLDGDIIRNNLCKDLSFSREDRDTNVARVGYVCSLLNKHGINTVVALISPFREAREKLRLHIPNFIEVYVDTPLQVCIDRDVKGLYKKAMAGDIPEFTGISSPYEPPLNPEIVLKTQKDDLSQCVQHILDYLRHRALITD